MTPAQLRAALADINTYFDGQGHGILLLLKDGTEVAGDYYTMDNIAANPAPGIFRVDQYASTTTCLANKRNPISFVDIESIACVSGIDLGVSNND